MNAVLRGVAVACLAALAACGDGGSDDGATAIGYSTRDGKVFDPSGNAVQLRGINMFGFNSDILIPQYLDRMGWKQQLQQVRALDFNAVRLPFVPETLYSALTIGEGIDTTVDRRLNADIIGKTPLQMLDLWMAEADRQGLYVVLDFHSVSKNVLQPVWFVDDPAVYAADGSATTYNQQAYSAADWVRDLQFVATRYADNAHFVGIDLYNEPHDEVRWGGADGAGYRAAYDWKLAAETAGHAVLVANPRLLIFVQGIALNNDGIEDSSLPVNFGENLQPQAYRPLDLPRNKLVLFPHTYGPDVSAKSSFADPLFPANLPADWEKLFGRFRSDYTVIVGEFGGYYGSGPSGVKDRQWQDALVDYLVSKNLRSAFYWCYTPNSADTGGILDENLNPRRDKLELLQRLFRD